MRLRCLQHAELNQSLYLRWLTDIWFPFLNLTEVSGCSRQLFFLPSRKNFDISPFKVFFSLANPQRPWLARWFKCCFTGLLTAESRCDQTPDDVTAGSRTLEPRWCPRLFDQWVKLVSEGGGGSDVHGKPGYFLLHCPDTSVDRLYIFRDGPLQP